MEGGYRWNARDRTVTARMEQYLNESDSLKEEVEELELLLGPEDSEVDLRHILRCATRRDRRMFDIFSRSEQLAASRMRWDGAPEADGDTGGKGRKECARSR